MGTPQCKARTWQEELKALREILLDSPLTEELKWSVPCYTFQKSNVVILSALKESCTLSFFKGALLKDPHGILTKPGENTQAGRLIRFTSVQQIVELASIVKAYIAEAIEIEKSGVKVNFKAKGELVYPEELQTQFAHHPALKTAFEALTPGRQRGYLLYFTAPKQSKTRASRIEKSIPSILDGKGLNDR